MGRRLAVVTAIDRANRVVRAQEIGGGDEFEAAYHPNRMPWPLAHAWFDDSAAPAWRCLGPVGARELIFHDDFTRVPSVTGTAGGALVSCDTPWTHTTDGTGGTSAPVSASDAQGALRLHRNAGIAGNNIHKVIDSVQPFDTGSTDALWMVWRVKFVQHPSTWGGVAVTAINLGLNDIGGTLAGYGFSLSGSSDHWSADSFNGGQDVSGVALVADTWYVCEFVINEVGFAAWIDGDGPYVEAAGGPHVGITPFAASGLVATSDGDANTLARDFDIDYVTLSRVSFISDPALFAERV